MSPHEPLPLFRVGPLERMSQEQVERCCIDGYIDKQLENKRCVASRRTVESACMS